MQESYQLFSDEVRVGSQDQLYLNFLNSSEADLTMTNQCVGTPYFMSPEQACDSKGVDCRADIYSLGATLYYLITGKFPYHGETTMEVVSNVLKGSLAPPEQHNQKISRECSQLCLAMMAKNIDDRPATWTSLIDDIGRVIKGQMPRTEPKLQPQISSDVAQLALKMSFWNKSKLQAAGPAPEVDECALREKLSAKLDASGLSEKYVGVGTSVANPEACREALLPSGAPSQVDVPEVIAAPEGDVWVASNKEVSQPHNGHCILPSANGKDPIGGLGEANGSVSVLRPSQVNDKLICLVVVLVGIIIALLVLFAAVVLASPGPKGG